jgi:hypothetical protein
MNCKHWLPYQVQSNAMTAMSFYWMKFLLNLKCVFVNTVVFQYGSILPKTGVGWGYPTANLKSKGNTYKAFWRIVYRTRRWTLTQQSDWSQWQQAIKALTAKSCLKTIYLLKPGTMVWEIGLKLHMQKAPSISFILKCIDVNDENPLFRVH